MSLDVSASYVFETSLGPLACLMYELNLAVIQDYANRLMKCYRASSKKYHLESIYQEELLLVAM
jgi:hypothetical protein